MPSDVVMGEKDWMKNGCKCLHVFGRYVFLLEIFVEIQSLQCTETSCFSPKLWYILSAGIPKLLTDVVKTSETNLVRSITEGKVSDTRTSDQAWLSYSSTQELRDLHNFTVQVRSVGVMATRPVLFDPCP